MDYGDGDGDSLRRRRESPSYNRDMDSSADNERYIQPYEVQLAWGEDQETLVMILDMRGRDSSTSEPNTPLSPTNHATHPVSSVDN
ncbi:predicted protein [Sclerotinia sclerotiorum 1980 UF-70]|uniref:Uncharacterized protein n=1 Tax=Sclerotinia sclerotiorum (strain ATCC 18683 / 1980 / Ss-1) TaxID=665079 RepID=A7EK67_SCLS1|nr:predicted protein [Sclerotinia sclerotiorum 1980 UF-70]EDO03233.1 predicted protein [Sclerotinia sclerotiorum 1980 UF-70]